VNHQPTFLSVSLVCAEGDAEYARSLVGRAEVTACQRLHRTDLRVGTLSDGARTVADVDGGHVSARRRSNS
jgi:hypothetical protein